MRRYVVLEKRIGETPLSCAEAWRDKNPIYKDVPLAYAGRLDPMASGKLLILIGDECKHQTNYHGLDKEYEFSILLNIGSDSHDVLGRLSLPKQSPIFTHEDMEQVTRSLIGHIRLPYPHFSAKTVQGKPLHMWTLENRLHEIEIPTKESEVFFLEVTKIETIERHDMIEKALGKINSIPRVTDPRKKLGNDFRRIDVRKDWAEVKNNNNLPPSYQIIHLRCIASSGTYMRSLAEVIGRQLNTHALAWHIHRTKIGIYRKHSWIKEF